MTDSIKSICFGILGGLVVLLVSGLLAGSDQAVGGVYNNVIQDFSEGISVDGTTVIDGSRNITANKATISSSATSSVNIQGTSASCLVMQDAGGTDRYFRPNETVTGGMSTTTAAYCGY